MRWRKYGQRGKGIEEGMSEPGNLVEGWGEVAMV